MFLPFALGVLAGFGSFVSFASVGVVPVAAAAVLSPIAGVVRVVLALPNARCWSGSDASGVLVNVGVAVGSGVVVNVAVGSGVFVGVGVGEGVVGVPVRPHDTCHVACPLSSVHDKKNMPLAGTSYTSVPGYWAVNTVTKSRSNRIWVGEPDCGGLADREISSPAMKVSCPAKEPEKKPSYVVALSAVQPLESGGGVCARTDPPRQQCRTNELDQKGGGDNWQKSATSRGGKDSGW